MHRRTVKTSNNIDTDHKQRTQAYKLEIQSITVPPPPPPFLKQQKLTSWTLFSSFHCISIIALINNVYCTLLSVRLALVCSPRRLTFTWWGCCCVRV